MSRVFSITSSTSDATMLSAATMTIKPIANEIATFSTDEIAAINVKALPGLSTDDIAALDSEQAQAFTSQQIAALSSSQVEAVIAAYNDV